MPFLTRLALDNDLIYRSFSDDHPSGEVKTSETMGQLQVSSDWPHSTIVVNEAYDPEGYAEDYAPNEDLDERFRREVRGLRFFTVRFHDIELTRRLLREIAEEAVSRGDIAWFDSDWGWVISASEFLRRTNENPRWDWRYAADQEEREG